MLQNIVTPLKQCIQKAKLDITIYAHLPGQSLNGNTVPPHILPTTERPDICLVMDKKIVLVELTVPFEPSIDKSHKYKLSRYEKLVSDINNCDFECDLVCIEIGSRGIITKENKKHFQTLFNNVQGKRVRKIWCSHSKVSLISSYVTFNARKEPNWLDMKLLS